MSHEHDISKLWERLDRLPDPLPWRNAPDQTNFRSYGADAKLMFENGRLRIAVRSAKTFVALFGFLFVPAFSLVAWLAIPELPTGLFFTIGGFVVGVLTFGVIYALFAYHERLGDYLIIDRTGHNVELPRNKVQFPIDQVFSFQWITGRSNSSSDVETDLNLLVAERDELVRYHKLGTPQRAMIEEVVRFSGIRVQEIASSAGVYRDADSTEC